jgi:N-ethylmaleimide reductase
MTSLFDSTKLGRLTLPNRIVMAPLTRNRAGRDAVPGDLAAVYYAQRASAGLIISEGIQPCAEGQGFFDTPGLHSEEQVLAWRSVTDAVHRAGGLIFAQLMHSGRIGHPDLAKHSSLPAGVWPVAPSAVRPTGTARTQSGPRPFVTPRPMTLADIAATTAAFADAARNAVRAGFDGVELHGAGGMLLHQFLADSCNLRVDGYGGDVDRRIRFPLEVTAAVADAVGPERVGLRVSPHNTFYDVHDSTAEATYLALTRGLAGSGLAYLHVYEVLDRAMTVAIRAAWPGTLIVNPHPKDRRNPAGWAEAAELLKCETADLVSFGRLFIANPDLPHRFRRNLALNSPEPETFYGGNHQGYTDYSFASAGRTASAAPENAPKASERDEPRPISI